MKKFYIYIFTFVLFLTRVTPNFAYDIYNNVSSSTPIIVLLSPSPIPSDYQLPYPGLLPDNFLYKLKAFRDKLVEFLISDPLKKAEFDILQADKRYNAGLYLFRANPQKEDIIISTFSKADNYMEEAIGQLMLAKKQGEEIPDLTNKLLLSDQKHLEVIISIEKKSSSSLKKSFYQEEGRVAHIKATVISQLQHK